MSDLYSGSLVMTKSMQLRRSNLLGLAAIFAISFGVLSLQPAAAQTYTVLHAFTGHPDGDTPLAGVTLDGRGNIYGTAAGGGIGGNYQKGTVWKIDGNGVFSVLYTFTGGVGSGPDTALLLDRKGNLYGTTQAGGHFTVGSVYSVAPDGKAKELYAFSRDFLPVGRLALDRHRGILYGTTQAGGTGGCIGGCGTAWQLAPTHRLTFLHRFAGAPDGAAPQSGLVRDAPGSVYGATGAGGNVTQQCPEGCGTVFKITRAGRKSTLYEFQGGNDGISPAEGDLVLDASGNIYGTTVRGGGTACAGPPPGCGTVFKVSPSGQETVLYRFQNGSDSAFPEGGVVLDGKGGLYGTTLNAIFHVDANGKETVLYTQTDCTNGCNFNSDLAIDAAGALYGTTSSGGDLSCQAPSGCGVVFKLEP
jgi:uncharacterized repeat protein (TIGR03803 family)